MFPGVCVFESVLCKNSGTTEKLNDAVDNLLDEVQERKNVLIDNVISFVHARTLFTCGNKIAEIAEIHYFHLRIMNNKNKFRVKKTLHLKIFRGNAEQRKNLLDEIEERFEALKESSHEFHTITPLSS